MNVAPLALDTAPAALMPPKPAGAVHSLTHMQLLEAESIYIIREAIAESENPVLLYSIGKDSSVLVHLALKAFYPAKPPFPLLHIDTTWKFRDMIAFRDRRAGELGLKLIVHINHEGRARGIGPISHPELHADVMKTQALPRRRGYVQLSLTCSAPP
jgi:sulfate adenylyltransferase subunit 2